MLLLKYKKFIGEETKCFSEVSTQYSVPASIQTEVLILGLSKTGIGTHLDMNQLQLSKTHNFYLEQGFSLSFKVYATSDLWLD